MAATTSRMPEQYQPLQEEEVDDVPFTPLKALQNVGVQQADIKKLSEAGFATVEQILMTSKRKLTDVKGLSEAKVAKIGDAANKVCPNKLAFKSQGLCGISCGLDTNFIIRRLTATFAIAAVYQMPARMRTCRCQYR